MYPQKTKFLLLSLILNLPEIVKKISAILVRKSHGCHAAPGERIIMMAMAASQGNVELPHSVQVIMHTIYM